MDYDFQKAGLYPAAWAAFKANLLTMFGLAIGLMFIEYTGPKLDLGIATWFLPILLEISAAFLIHQIIISGKVKPWFTMAEKDGTSGGFVSRSLAFLLVLVAVGIIAGMIPFIIGYRGAAAEQIAIMMIIYIGLPVYCIVLALFGTVLPATVAQSDRSLGTAFKRGRSQFWYVCGRFIIGPVLFILATGAIFYFLSATDIPVDVYATNNVFSPVGALLSFSQYLLSLFATSLAATILCKAYLRYEQVPKLPPEPVCT